MTDNRAPELLITDYHMPGLTGDQVISLYKVKFPDLKTVMISGYIGDAVVSSFKQTPDVFLKKPFRATELLRVVESLTQVNLNPATVVTAS